MSLPTGIDVALTVWLIAANAWILRRPAIPTTHPRWWIFECAWALLYITSDVLVWRESTWLLALHAVAVGLWAHDLWRRRPRRRPRPQRAAGRVVDLGHRLSVVR